MKIQDDGSLVLELLTEIFDDAIDKLRSVPKLSEQILIFGGTPRDIVSNRMDDISDLDITLSSTAFGEVHNLFRYSPNWMISRTAASGYSGRIYEFKNVVNRRVQLIKSDPPEKSSVTADLRCCCLVIDVDGNIRESVAGAIEDCENGILKLNSMYELKTMVSAKKALKRIDKLLKRGWKVDERTVEVLKEFLNKNIKMNQAGTTKQGYRLAGTMSSTSGTYYTSDSTVGYTTTTGF